MKEIDEIKILRFLGDRLLGKTIPKDQLNEDILNTWAVICGEKE